MSNTNEQRRRSTRVSQLVPVVVRGMDLLGQPFEEHTTTTNFNFHGCAYASRHHLPRNTWISIEPLQEGLGGQPSCVRARVVWIDQPQMAYDQFQIAVELESPANIWGVSAPEDWENRNIPESGYTNSPYANNPDQPTDAYNTLPEQSEPQQMEQAMTFGNSQGDFSAPLNGGSFNGSNGPMETGQIGTGPLESMGPETNGHEASDQPFQNASQEPVSRADEMFQKWREHFELAQSKAGEQLSSEINERLIAFEREVRTGLETETAEGRNKLGEIAVSLEGRCEALRAELNAAENSLSAYADLHRRLDELKADLERRNEEIASDAWRHQLRRDVQLAHGQWDELLQSSLDSAVQRLSQRLAENSNEILTGVQQRIESMLGGRTERARELLRELSLREMQSEESLRLYRERLRQTTENTNHEVRSQSESTVAELRADLQTSRNEALSGFSADLGAIRESATQAMDYSLGRSVESHVERAREQMEALASDRLRVLEEAATLKAQAVSRDLETEQAGRVAQFGTDSQMAAGQAVEDSRRKIEEAAQEAARRIAGEMNAAASETVAGSRFQIEQAAAAAAASFGQVLTGISDQALDQFRQSSRGTADERTSDIERSAAQLREEFERNVAATAEQLSGNTLSQIRHTLAEMSDVFRSECHATLESLKSGRECLQQEWQSSLDAMSAELIQNHKQRLENISNTWQADSLQRLNDRGDEVIQRLSRTGEQVVRNSFTRIFDGLSEAMRENFTNAAVAGASASVGQNSVSESGASETQLQH